METESVGQVDTTVGRGKCSGSACDGAAIISLDQQAYCLKHFLERCYQRLQEVDPRGKQYPSAAASPAAMRAFVEECSRKALDVCMGSEELSNLERSRLLDILLWAGELFLLLRAPRTNLVDASSVDCSDNARIAATRL